MIVKTVRTVENHQELRHMHIMAPTTGLKVESIELNYQDFFHLLRLTSKDKAAWVDHMATRFGL